MAPTDGAIGGNTLISSSVRVRERETVEDLLERPWCYYREKDLDDVNILQTHQREKHFACENGCTRKLNTASGLQVHTQQVHKKTITQIRDALPGREDPGVEIFGSG